MAQPERFRLCQSVSDSSTAPLYPLERRLIGHRPTEYPSA